MTLDSLPGAFADHLVDVATACGGDPAVAQGSRVLSWREFDAESLELAGRLARHGIRTGSRVGIASRNCPEYLVALFALYRMGAVPVNVNYRYQAAELVHVLSDCRAEGLVHSTELATVVDAALPSLPRCAVRIEVDSISGGFDLSRSRAVDDRAERTSPGRGDEWLLYTGGTTGLPKAVVGSQRERLRVVYGLGLENLDWRGEPDPAVEEVIADRRRRGLTPVYFAISPLMHGTGLYCALIGLAIGATVLLSDRRSFDPDDFARSIGDHRVTDTHVVGEAMMLPFVEALERAAGAGHPYDVDSLRRIQSSGAVWTARTKRRLLDHLDATLTDMVAATEGGPFAISIASRTRMPADETAFSLVPGARVLDDNDVDVSPGSGVVGLLAAPTSPVAHYLGDPARSERVFRDVDGRRYVVPGDLADIAENGDVRFVGRDSSVINSAGEKVYAEEVERILRQHPGVTDVVVAGVPDDRFGSVVGAVVVPVPGASLDREELAAFVGADYSDYKKPRVVVCVPELARLASAKPDLRWAREILIEARRKSIPAANQDC